MAGIAVPAWALVNCILAQAVTVTATDRTEVRARVQSSDVRFDAETRPAFRLALTTPQTGYSFGYGPALTALAVGEEGGRLILTQSADASAQYRWEHTSVSISESGSVGTLNLRAQAIAAPAPTGGTAGTPTGGNTGTTPPGGTGTMPPGGTGTTPGPTGPIAAAQSRLSDRNITSASSQTTVTMRQIFSTRTFGTLTGRYEYSGPIGATSEQDFPVRRGPSVTLSVRHRASLTDELTTVADGTALETGSTLHAQIVELAEQWTHHFAPTLVGSFLVGAAAARSELDGLSRRRTTALVPTSTASVDYLFSLAGGRMQLASFVRLAPLIDRFTGDFDQRLRWIVDVNWTRYRLSLLANLSGAQSVLPRVAFTDTTVLPYNFYSSSASVLYRFTRELSAEGGLRAAWFRTDGDPFPLLWSVFAAGTYTLSATYL